MLGCDLNARFSRRNTPYTESYDLQNLQYDIQSVSSFSSSTLCASSFFRFPLTFYLNIKIHLTTHFRDFNTFTNFLYCISSLIFSHLLFKTFYLHFREKRTHLVLKMKQSHMDGRGGRPNEPNQRYAFMECILNNEWVSRRAKPALSTVQIESEVCFCVCVCVCIYMCVCVYIYIYTHTHTHTLRIYNEWKMETLSTNFRW